MYSHVFWTKRKSAIGLLLLFAAAGAVVTVVRSWYVDAQVVRADPERILHDAVLRARALAGGKAVYLRYCATCHGPAGKGEQRFGVPDLTDADRLYGSGKVAEIEDIARFGIRASNARGRNLAVMPRYASPVPDAAEPLPPQTPGQIEDLTQYLLSFTGRATDASAATRGKVAYEKAGCWDCHERDAGGDASIGAPTLTDDIWLYGGSRQDIVRTLERGRAGVSPAFVRTLSPMQLRTVAIYVTALAPAPAQKP